VEAVAAIKKAVEDGELSLERINGSVARILKAKAKYAESPVENFEVIVGCEEHRNYARFISQSSITLIHNNLNLVPLKSKNILTISPGAGRLNIADDIAESLNFAETASESLGGDFITVEINPAEDQIEDVLKTVNNYEVIVLATYNSHLNKGQEKLLDKVLQAKKEVIHVALRNPYDAIDSKKAGAALCSYEYTEQAVESIVNVLNGTAAATGKLPISLEV
jgi:beta-N-acetylhexosaminidase